MIPFSDADVRNPTLPVVTLTLIGISCLVFLYELQVGGFGVLTGGGSIDINIFFLKWGFIPDELTSGEALTGLRTRFEVLNIETPLPTWTTLFTSMFVHGGFFHLAGNMMFLWVFGDNIESRLGRFKFLAFYLAAGVAAALSQLAIDPNSQTPLVGASGAISGVLGAYLLTFPFNRIKAIIIFYIITVVELPAIWLLGGWFIWQLIQGAMSLGLSNTVSVAFFAHIGGFVAGVILIAAYRVLIREPILPVTRRRPPWDNWFQASRR